MKNISALLLCVSSFLCCMAQPIRAQSGPQNASLRPPILPMEIKFRHVSQYFMQRINDDPRYSEIEALLDPDRYEVILTDKITDKREFYTGTPQRVRVLQAHNLDAYLAPVSTENFVTVDSYSAVHVRFVDHWGQEIDWEFIAGQMISHAAPEVIPEPNEHGVLWIYAPRRANSAAGTVLTIAGREHPATETASLKGIHAIYAEDLTIAQIVSGAQRWSIVKGPGSLTEGAEWIMREESGQARKLIVKKISDLGLQIEQTDRQDPDAAPMLLDLDLQPDGYSLHSVSLAAQSNTFWIFFDPGLPLPSQELDDKSDIAFEIAEDEQAGLAQGRLTVHRSPEGEKVTWSFETPEALKADGFETVVNITSKQATPNANRATSTN